MRDNVDPETRRRIMRAIKGKDTALELRLRSLLWHNGVRGYRCHVRSVAGNPDLAWIGLRVAVFLDSAWWHGHPSRWTPGRLPGSWDAKISRNRERDAEVTTALTGAGWRVVRIWDFELKRESTMAIERVRAALDEARAVPRLARNRQPVGSIPVSPADQNAS